MFSVHFCLGEFTLPLTVILYRSYYSDVTSHHVTQNCTSLTAVYCVLISSLMAKPNFHLCRLGTATTS
jgi:hypothetical protein